MKCGDCKQDILQKNPDMCPYCKGKNLMSDEEALKAEIDAIKKLEKAGKLKEASIQYEELGFPEKAAQIRKKMGMDEKQTSKQNYGRIALIRLECPYCRVSQVLDSKAPEIKCENCKKTYKVPESIVDLL